MVTRRIRTVVTVMLLGWWGWTLAAGPYNGFDVEPALIPVAEIHAGGPPRDGIPALHDPRFVAAGKADFLRPDSRVIGLVRGGEAKAYPIAILNWHEVVNDRIDGAPVVVTYCPLCGTGVVYSGLSEGRRLTIGVSGLLYNSDVLLYDTQTESLWSQLRHEAVSGPRIGARLEPLPAQLTTWERWSRAHPRTRVLSTDTGYHRDYGRDPYGGYGESVAVHFPVAFTSRRYHPKERVLGVELGGESKAYPFAELSRRGPEGSFEDRVGGRTVRIEYDAPSRSGRVFDADGEELAVVNGFWFAWFTFHPDTEVYEVRVD